MKSGFKKLEWRLRSAGLPELAYYLLKDEAISGKLILIATVLALVAVNSSLYDSYLTFWNTDFQIGIGRWIISKDLRGWVDEGLMTIFFLVVGLELKRELVRGELRRFKTAVLPFAAAIGGMVVPALIFMSFNKNKAGFDGWAIPMATDIAFAIGILALLGKRIPSSIRLFLLTLAIVDDIGAIIIIALFYSTSIELSLLAGVVLTSVLILILRRNNKLTMPIFLVLGVSIWLLVDGSGVHPSISGALIGMLAPLTAFSKRKKSIAEKLEKSMIPVSTLIVVPLFAFANTGIVLSLNSFDLSGAYSVAGGIFFGLVLGKFAGIFGVSWLMVRLRLAVLPKRSNWNHMAGVGLLAGIGFTVSIFVTELAFDNQHYIDISKLAVFFASAISGVLGIIVLRRLANK